MILLVNLIAGMLGGNIAAGFMKHVNLGLLGNSLFGVAGGGVGGQVLASLGFRGMAIPATTYGGIDTFAFLGQAGAAGACGALALFMAGAARNLVVR